MGKEIKLNRISKKTGGRCHLCGKPVSKEDRSRDHIIPQSHGGPNRIQNLKLAHRDCNSARGNKVIISEAEALNILVGCQRGKCFFCADGISTKNSHITVYIRVNNQIMAPLMVAACLQNCGGSTIPAQNSRKKEIVMSDMNVVDTLTPDQLEAGDYVSFKVGNKIRTGMVIEDITDHGDFITVPIHDEEVDDKVAYNVRPDADVSLLMYASVAV